MYSKSVENIFELDNFRLLEGLYPLQSGFMKTAPKYKGFWETSFDVRVVFFSQGKAIIRRKETSWVTRKNDVYFLFPNCRYQISVDSNTVCEVWWVDMQGAGVKWLLRQIDVSPEKPVVSGITTPILSREFKTLGAYSDDRLPSDTLHLASSLYKICALLLDACTTSDWRLVPYTDQDIIYTGNWTTWPSPSGTKHEEIYTSTTKSFAEYNFYGSGIRWYGTMNFDCGLADVIIDGIYQTTVDTYSPERLTHQLMFTDSKLPEGNHIIKIFCTGKKNDQATNCDIVIDSFQYYARDDKQPNFSQEFGISKKASNIIRAEYMKDISVDALAKQLGVSRSYLTCKFKNDIGLSPTQFIKSVRIDHAKHLLCATDQAVSEIAASVGFSDTFYFCRMFKAVENVTPSEYRKLHQK